MLPDMLENFGQSVVATLLFSNNLLLAMTSGYWELETGFKPLVHTWSLGVEEQFYIVFPVFLAVIWRFGSRAVLISIAVIGLISLGLAEAGWRLLPDENFYLPTGRAWELMVGALCALVTLKPRATDNLLSLAGLLAIAAAIFLFNDRLPYPSFYTLVPVLGSAAVLMFTRPGTLAYGFLSWRPMVGIGLISYSTYLWHQPLFAFARIESLEPPSPLKMAVLTVLTFVLAGLTWKFVENPFRDRRLIRMPQLVGALGLGTAALAAFGVFLYIENGVPSRMFPGLASGADMYIAYNERIRAYKADTFPDNGLDNVLVAGNSTARDVANVLMEAQVLDGRNFIYRDDIGSCQSSLNPVQDGLLKSADIVIVSASALNPTCTTDTYAAYQAATDAHVVFVGPKHFGYNMNPFGRVPMAERSHTKAQVPVDIVQSNITLAKSIPAGSFVDLIAMLGGDGSTLPVFDANGMPVSQDRVHLTKYGAVFAAPLVRKMAALGSFAEPVSDGVVQAAVATQ